MSNRAAVKAVLLVAVCGSSAAFAADPAPQPTNQELLEKVARLEAKVEKLEAERTQNAPSVQATQTSLKQAAESAEILSLGNVNVHYRDGGFQIATDDGRFSLHPFFHFQFLNVLNYRDNANGAKTASDSQNGFEVRRMEFGFEGNAFTKDFNYIFLWDTDPHNGTPFLELAFGAYHLPGTPWALKVGQIKDPFDHEQMGSSAQFLAVQRTLVVDALAAGDAFTHAVTLTYDNDGAFRSEFGFSDGIGSWNQTYQDYPTNLANWGVAGRAEYKLFGSWGQYSDASARNNTQPLLVTGAGIDYTETGGSSALRHVVDVQYETASGVGIYAAYLGRYTHRNPAGNAESSTTGGTYVANIVRPGSNSDNPDTYDCSFRAQIGYAIDTHWEPFLRYDFLGLDNKGLPAGVHGSVNEVTAGFNYYLYGQQAKFSFDVDYLPNGSPISDDGLGIRFNGGACQLLVRTQFQLLL